MVTALARVASASFVLLLASTIAASRAGAQSGPAPRRSELGPDLSAPDASREKERQSHVPTKAPPRRPSPPDGPDEDPDAGRSYAQCETAIAADPADENHIVGVAVDLEAGYAVTRWYTSFDGGATWSTGAIADEPGYLFNGDPAVVITPDGVPVIALLQYWGAGGSAVYSYRSLDGGLTWQPGVRVDLDPGDDKVQAAVDLSSGPHHGQIALAWDRFGTSKGDLVYTAVSDDGGSTWQHVQRVDDVNNVATIAPDVAYGPDSELWVTWADRGNFDIQVDRSTDGGATFGADVKAGDYSQVPSSLPNSYFRIFDIFSIAVDWTNGPYSGYVYVLYHKWTKTQVPFNADVFVLRSTDDGATWEKFNVNKSDTTEADQVMPFAQVDEHGNLDVAYFDRRLDPNNFLLWTWVARSSDGGHTFAEFPASDVGWDHAASDNPWYIGDYLGLDVTSHAVHTLFADGRTGSIDVRGDALHLDLHTDVSEISAATGGVVTFTLNVGPNHASDVYWLLGSTSTAPGLDFRKVHLPLNYDWLFECTMALTNSSTFQNSLGALDPTGSAVVVADVEAPIDASLVGTDLYFAALLWDPKPVFATNATVVTVVP